MKSPSFLLLALAVAGLLAQPVHAETPLEREFQQATDQHDRAVAAAIQPIDRAYQTALEALLKRAAQSGDLDTNAKVIDALRKLGPRPDAATAGSSGPAGASTLATRIEELLVSTPWVHNGTFHYRFTRGGSVTLREPHPRGQYKIDGKTGFVSFTWERNQFPGEGIQYDEKAGNFVHNKGGTLVPSK